MRSSDETRTQDCGYRNVIVKDLSSGTEIGAGDVFVVRQTRAFLDGVIIEGGTAIDESA